MRLLPQLVLNFAIVGVALFAYDALRTDAGSGPAGAVPVADASIELENRIAALEAARRPTLEARGVDPSVEERLRAFERRLDERAVPAAAEPGEEATGSAAKQAPLFSKETAEAPTPEEVQRFLRLQKAAREEERLLRHSKQVEARLAKLDVRLTAKQRARLVRSYAAFQPRRNAIWSGVKSAAQSGGAEVDWEAVVREGQTKIRNEFAEEAAGFLPRADADVVAASLFPAGGK
jgi:hypothetical protein